MRIKRFFENKEETGKLDKNRIEKFAKGLHEVCLGEYGYVYINESNNHVFISLGDSHFFDEKMLENTISYELSKNTTPIKITIENESIPDKPDDQGEWLFYDINKNKFVPK